MVSENDALWNDPGYWSEPAERAFARARRMALRESLADRLRRRPSALLSFETATDGLGLMPDSAESSQTVPIARIVGSVGKESLFTRSFLPRSGALLPRWKKVYALSRGFRGYEPVELYEVGGLFYVVDGHFRLSVTRAMDENTIQARVRRWV